MARVLQGGDEIAAQANAAWLLPRSTYGKTSRALANSADPVASTFDTGECLLQPRGAAGEGDPLVASQNACRHDLGRDNAPDLSRFRSATAARMRWHIILYILSDADEFRKETERARRLAAHAGTGEDQAFWLSVADDWIKLADAADKAR
jgi:hypothetical protein